MADTYWQILTETLSPDIREILGKELLDLLKAADRGQAIFEIKGHSIRSIFVGHNVPVPKLNGNGAEACDY
jgi:hypothetical protein